MTFQDPPPDVSAGPGPGRVLDRVQALRYVTVDNTPTYRAIIEIFAEAKSRYRVELRLAEVAEALTRGPWLVEARDEVALERDLAQLVEWGNLGRAHDTEAVSRIEDYYKKRFVYHLTALGEAAHRAVHEVEQSLGRSGSLQTAMLRRVHEALRELGRPAGSGAAGALLRAFDDLFAAFDSLTDEAARFIRELNTELGSMRPDEARYQLYKQAVLQYIARFVEELRQVTPLIVEALLALDDEAVRERLRLAATAAELPPRADGRDPRLPWVSARLSRWQGVRHWFIGRPGDEAVVERLREVAVQAVLLLTRTLGRLNDQRGTRIDRAADFRALARWFQACSSDDEAHALAAAAFGLYPSRHMHLAETDAELVSPGTSWWDAEPVHVPVRLRTRGSVTRTGRTPAAKDYGEHKLWMAQRQRRERAQAEEVRRRFLGGPFTLSDVGRLDPLELDLFLELLDQALGASRAMDGSRVARTADGVLEVRLVRPPAGELAWATLVTPRGRLRCLDYRVEVRRAESGATAALDVTAPDVAAPDVAAPEDVAG